MAPPRAPAASCAATSSSAASTALRRPRLSYARHLQPWLLARQLGYLDIGTKGYHPHELLAGFLSSRSIRTAPTLLLRGDVSPLATAFGFFSSHTVCSAPAVTAGEYYSIFGSCRYTYRKLPYVSRGALPHKSCTLIYTGRGLNAIHQLHQFYPFYTDGAPVFGFCITSKFRK